MPKLPKFKRTKRFGKRILAFNEHKSSLSYIKGLYQRNFIPPKESDEIVEYDSLKLSPEQEQMAQKKLKIQLRIVLVFIVLGLMVFVEELIRAHWDGVFGSVIFCCVMLSLAFRYHFWLFQLKQKRLGCTVEQWADSLFKRGPKS